MTGFGVQFFEQCRPLGFAHLCVDLRMVVQGAQQVPLVPAFDDREGIQQHVTAGELLQHLVQRRAGFDGVLAGMHGASLAGDPGIQAQQGRAGDDPLLREPLADPVERRARRNLEGRAALGHVDGAVEKPVDMPQRSRGYQEQRGGKDAEQPGEPTHSGPSLMPLSRSMSVSLRNTGCGCHECEPQRFTGRIPIWLLLMNTPSAAHNSSTSTSRTPQTIPAASRRVRT